MMHKTLSVTYTRMAQGNSRNGAESETLLYGKREVKEQRGGREIWGEFVTVAKVTMLQVAPYGLKLKEGGWRGAHGVAKRALLKLE